MIPRLHISFSYVKQLAFCFGKSYLPQKGEYLLNHARSGIVLALRAALPSGGRVGVAAYNCHTVANAVVEAGCTPVFVDVTENLHVDILHLATLKMDAIVVTNLFGIHNDIDAIRKVQPNAIIIVDLGHPRTSSTKFLGHSTFAPARSSAMNSVSIVDLAIQLCFKDF